MSPYDSVRLRHMIDAIESAQQFAQGRSRSSNVALFNHGNQARNTTSLCHSSSSRKGASDGSSGTRTEVLSRS